MKKLLLLTAVAMLFCFAGCKKTCHCTTTQTFPGEAPMVTQTTVTIDKGKCTDMNATQTTSFDGDVMTQTIDCVQE
ncbi:MAG: hypothetical protein J5741_08240 [Bacteroidales bacterium]|jgi:uncharacterized lipoprotein YajG|nr:hypothetical protein [Bacteroidales bacterium]